ncbi:hypothetical protein M9H77_20968 [Catharanthus roseus]|uniref:Uncharacterized protein n=1 Tax=Catharanthus roseus TaxID=4058 RepID=A0ACC0AL84_CATRO|nr:hypothetical protein M9H77_20968 [Catharanthus roseus]
MTTSENWQLFVHNGRHNHKIAIYNHGHHQAARLMQQTEQFRKSHVPPRNILRFFREQNVGCAVSEFYDICSAQKIYNVVAKIKKNRMKGRNTVEEVICLSAERGLGFRMIFKIKNAAQQSIHYRKTAHQNMKRPSLLQEQVD